MSTGNANGDERDGNSPEGEERPASARDVSEAPPSALSGRAGAMTWAYRTILTLISATLLLLILAMVRQPRPQNDPQPPDRPSAEVYRNRAGPAPIPADELEGRAERQWRQFAERMRREPLPETDHAIEERIDTAFAPVYERIPAFLDWHYSIVGQYTELGHAALGALEEAIESRLFAELQERIGTATDTVGRVMQEEMRTEIENWLRRESQTVPPGLTTTYERMLEVTVADTVERFTVSAFPSAVAAVGAGAGGTVAVALLAKALAKKMMATIGLKTAGKTVGGIWGRLGGAAGGAAIGSVLGPFGVVIGGVAGGAAAWLAVDGVVVNIDERLHREDLERELTELVDEQKARVKSATSTAVDEVKLEALGEFTPFELGNRD